MFPDPTPNRTSTGNVRPVNHKDEVRLLYVAMARAKKALMIPQEIDLFLTTFRFVSDSHWSQMAA